MVVLPLIVLNHSTAITLHIVGRFSGNLGGDFAVRGPCFHYYEQEGLREPEHSSAGYCVYSRHSIALAAIFAI